MFSAVINYLEQRKTARIVESYRVGYGWAWAEHMLNDVSLNDLQDQLLIGPFDHPMDPSLAFDRGARHAITDMTNLLPGEGDR